MRFKIDFRLIGDPPYYLPVNYQNEFSVWVHKMLHFESPGFTEWLKTKGYSDSNGEYTLYTFSDILFGAHKYESDRLLVEQDKANMIISFYADPEIEKYITDIFEGKEFKIGDNKGKVMFRAEKVKKLPDPIPSGAGSLNITTLSPVLISDGSKNNGVFLSPDEKGFDKVFFKSLMFKYANLVKFMSGNPGNGLPDLQSLEFKLIGKPKAKTVKVKTDSPHQKSVKGYHFDFRLKAPLELLKIGMYGGFGELNHLGFGCCDVKK
jgi:CRISPR-associated endoribonuclease Cas6